MYINVLDTVLSYGLRAAWHRRRSERIVEGRAISDRDSERTQFEVEKLRSALLVRTYSPRTTSCGLYISLFVRQLRQGYTLQERIPFNSR